MNNKEILLKKVGEKYRKGLVSLAEAATLANVSIYRMMEYIEHEKLQASSLSEAEMKEDLKRSKKLFEEIKK